MNIKLNFIKDSKKNIKKKKKLLKRERNKIRTQLHNIIKNVENNSIKYVLEDLERNENDAMKMHEAV